MNNKTLISIIAVLVLIVGASLYFIFQDKDVQIKNKCGDNLCDEIERLNPNLCISDCKAYQLVCGDGICDANEKNDSDLCPKDCQQTDNLPYYFMAIHNEPHHGESDQQQLIKDEYLRLERMIEKADEYNIKLTLMFSSVWAEYISSSSERMDELNAWKNNGHEIAIHHHSIYHTNWDGYTDYTPEEARQERLKLTKNPENYLGTLDDLMKIIQKINPNVKSGCVNEEKDKNAMPDEIIYSTCSRIANHGEPGTNMGDSYGPEKGKNEFIVIGTVKNISRKWLSHYNIAVLEREEKAEPVFDSLEGGLYGVVTHSLVYNDEPFYNFLELAHSKDPQGQKSKTVSEIIEERLLPEEKIIIE